jgi:hypothetical protein
MAGVESKYKIINGFRYVKEILAGPVVDSRTEPGSCRGLSFCKKNPAYRAGFKIWMLSGTTC